MATPSSILLEIQTQLRASSDLSAIDNSHILLGIRENITNYPSIFIEPLRIEDKDFVYQRQEMDFHIAILGYVKQTGSKDDLVADGSTDGILNLENKIKIALDGDRTLNAKVIHFWYVETVYDFYNYPIRNLGIEIGVRFRQTSGTRT